jgi:hypothetical protein
MVVTVNRLERTRLPDLELQRWQVYLPRLGRKQRTRQTASAVKSLRSRRIFLVHRVPQQAVAVRPRISAFTSTLGFIITAPWKLALGCDLRSLALWPLMKG